MQHSNAQLHNKIYMYAKDVPKNSLNNQKVKKKKNKSTKPSKTHHAKIPLNIEKR